MGNYQEEYAKLNKEQRLAVDTIEGPLLVLAGPGTGKTQLLSTRVANIIDKTDTPASSILCLTFTDSAARNMRNRLIGIIGDEAYHVAIHTFHSFGLEVMGQYPQYFLKYLGFRPIDKITQHEIICQLLSALPKTDPLSVLDANGELVWHKSVPVAIAQLKKAAIKPDQLREILHQNHEFTTKFNLEFNQAFSGRWQGKNINRIIKSIEEIIPKLKANQPDNDWAWPPLGKIIANELEIALNSGKPAVLEWRQKRLSGKDGERQLKETEQTPKLKSLANVYESYQQELLSRRLNDYEDMILKVLDKMDEEPNLLAELQEKYLYILVDEFQDTNDAQLKLLLKLADNPVHEGRPNVMVVGDDDQAIYRFQGAEAFNMLSFKQTFRDTALITIKQNYRSTQNILDASRYVINFCEQRIENTESSIDKSLISNQPGTGTINCFSLPDTNSEYAWIGSEIKRLIESGTKASDIAVIGRYHDDLLGVLPHIDAPIVYERRDDVTSEKHIYELLTLAKAVVAIANQDFNLLQGFIPEIISYEFWHLSVSELWKFAAKTKESPRSTNWFEHLLNDPDERFKNIALIIGELARREPTHTSEELLDWLIGNEPIPIEGEDITLVSPFKSFYFSENRFDKAKSEYINLLSGLTAIRSVYRQWRSKEHNRLRDFIYLINTANSADIRITDNAPHREQEDAVQIMTAHTAKGQEFDVVFLINATNETWDKAKRFGTSISWPANLPIAPAGDNDDDHARLFYVAMTRAKTKLYITMHKILSSGKDSTKLRFLSDKDNQTIDDFAIKDKTMHELSNLEEKLSNEWTLRHRQAVVDDSSALKQLLENYQLSPTDLNSFLDVTRGGPGKYLIHNLLRFPEAKSTSQAFGTAIHTAVAQAFTQQRFDPRLMIDAFNLALGNEDLNDQNYQREFEHGQKVIESLAKIAPLDVNQETKIEYPFAREGAVINHARLTGRIDQLTLIEGNWMKGRVRVSDWKTGKPRTRWDKADIGLHKGRQQLLFYKLLIENSRSFAKKIKVTSGELVYLEGPLKNDMDVRISLEYNPDDIEYLEKLITVVWQKINNLDFPDTSHYSNSVRGIIQFEKDLIDQKI